MTTRRIIRMGDPALLRVSEPVDEFDTPHLHSLVRDLIDTMQAADGAGLAAPQINILSRVVVFGVDSNPRYPNAEAVPQTVLINPIIEPLSDQQEDGWEGCLSVPGLRGMVPRYTHIRYSGFDQFGKVVEREANGFHARVVQHECDHLDGILYPQRMRNMKLFGYTDVLDGCAETTHDD